MAYGQQREQGLEGGIRSLLPELALSKTKTLNAEEIRKQRKLRGARARPLPQRTQDREQVTRHSGPSPGEQETEKNQEALYPVARSVLYIVPVLGQSFTK